MLRTIYKFTHFQNVLPKLEIVKLQANFEIAQPSLRNFEIVLHELEKVKLCSAISKVDVHNNIKRICIFP